MAFPELLTKQFTSSKLLEKLSQSSTSTLRRRFALPVAWKEPRQVAGQTTQNKLLRNDFKHTMNSQNLWLKCTKSSEKYEK